MSPTVTVVLPTAGRRPLERTLAATAGADEVVLGLDATVGAAGEAAVCAAAGTVGAQVVRADAPGASAARNAAWRHGTGDLVLLVDDDVVLDPGAVDAHRAAHAAGDPDRVTLGRPRWPTDRRVTAFETWVDEALQFRFAEIPADGETGWWHLYSCCAAIPRATLERVDGFDEVRFPFGYEDLDLGRRLDRAVGGLRVRLLPDGGGIHDTRMTLTEWRTRIRRIARTERDFVRAHPDLDAHLHARFVATRGHRPPRSGRVAAAIGERAPAGRLTEAVRRRAAIWWEHDLAARFLEEWARGPAVGGGDERHGPAAGGGDEGREPGATPPS